MPQKNARTITHIMGKDRTVAFTDAVLAIIMTILVLDLRRPQTLSWRGFASLWPQYTAYAVTFFWLGAMWINLHIEWEYAKNVSVGVLWWTIIMLFFASFTPYTTSIAAQNFFNPVAQVVYGIAVMLLSLANLMLSIRLRRVNPTDEEGLASRRHTGALACDFVIKMIGLVLGVVIWPPLIMVSVLIAAIVVCLPLQAGWWHEKRAKVDQ